MDLGLQGKTALITGGERGIGKDIGLSLAREGVDLAYCDIRIEQGEGSTQAKVKELGRKVFVKEVDVSVEEQVVKFIQYTFDGLFRTS